MTDQPTPAPTVKPKKQSKSITPADDLNLKDLSQSIAASWQQNLPITLIWTTPAAFATTVNLFDASLGQRLTTGGGRAVVTNQLKALDKTINEHTDYLKTYLKDLFGKDNFTSYFPQFGIAKERKSFVFPADSNMCSAALKMALEAIAAHGLQDKTYGLAFWQSLSQEYDAALKASVDTDGSVAGLVKTKNEHRQQIRKTLNALIHIIKGNYPDTYASVLREWGFQKEKY